MPDVLQNSQSLRLSFRHKTQHTRQHKNIISNSLLCSTQEKNKVTGAHQIWHFLSIARQQTPTSHELLSIKIAKAAFKKSSLRVQISSQRTSTLPQKHHSRVIQLSASSATLTNHHPGSQPTQIYTPRTLHNNSRCPAKLTKPAYIL